MALYRAGTDPSTGGIALVGDAGLVMKWHYMTYDEMLEAKDRLGVSTYDPSDASNGNGPNKEIRAPTEAEWLGMVGTQVIIEDMLGGAPSAETVDLTLSPFFPPIGNQGEVGSCAAWQETYYQFGFLKAKEMGWSDASTGNVAHLFCPTWTYAKQSGGTDAGSSPGDNAKIIAQFGAATMDVMPYVSTKPEGWLEWGDQSAWRTAVQYRCQGYSLIDAESASQCIALVKAALDNQIPVNFALNATNFENNIADYNGNKNNIISSSEYSFNDTDHAQTIVGYNDTVMDLDATPGAFKVANSHGSDFGISGCYYVTYDAFAKMAPNTSIGFINMTGSAGYSPSALATFQFSPGPTRDATLNVTAIQVSSGDVKAQFAASFNAGNEQRMSSFMCFDISNMTDYVNQVDYNIVLTASSSNQTGTISSFKVELYTAPYRINNPSSVTPESTDVPKETPGSVTAGKGAGVPSAPRDFAGMIISTGAQLSWSAPASDGGSAITNYKLYRSESAIGEYTLIASPTGTTYNDPGIVNTNWYKISAVNAIGEGAIATISVTGQGVPSAPLGLGGIINSTGAILAWSPPASDGGSPITSYNVYRAESASGEYTNIASPTDTWYTDPGRAYPAWYKVSAVNAFGEGANCTPISPNSVPGVPQNLVAAAGNAQVVLTWQAPASDGGSAIACYRVYRSNTESGTYESIALPEVLTYTDTGLVNGQPYWYKVSAANLIGEGNNCSVVSATPSPAPGPTVPGVPQNLQGTPGSAQAILTWTAPTSTGGSVIDYYVVYQNGSALPNHPTGLTATITGLTNGLAYSFTVAAHNSVGLGDQSAPVSVTPVAPTVPSAPQNVAANPGPGKVTITWTAPSSTGGSALTGYKVYRQLAGGAELLGTVGASTLSYADTTGTAGTTYFYYVVATNSIGSGPNSDPVSAAPQAANADNTMLYVGIAIAAIAVIAIVVVLMRRKK
ncbi:MAG: fibronectin type III domain-containing protein [Methanomassiliicoccales archaeon]